MALNSNFRTLTADNIEGIVDDRNYLKSSFENGTITGWTEVSVTLTSGLPTGTPTIGSTAASSLALSATSVTPLSGSRSLLVDVPSALTAGHGFISDEFTLDRMDLGKVLTVSFDYERVTGTYNFSGTLGSQTWMVYIYDATLGAANWIQPAGFLGMNQSSGPGRIRATFQSSVTAGQKYRVAVISSQAAAGASSIQFDNFTCSRQTAPIGPVVTDWVSYTPTFTGFGTPTNVSFFWRRSGDSLEINATFTTGTCTATEARISLPSGLTIDVSKISGNLVVGYGGLAGSTTPVNVLATGGHTYFRFGPNSNLSTIANNASSIFSNATAVSFQAFVPITGWSSNVQLSNDTDTRVVAAYLIRNSLSPQATNTPYNFGAAAVDTHGAWNGSTTYTIPVSGWYRISAQLQFNITATAGQFFNLAIATNGVSGDYQTKRANGAAMVSDSFMLMPVVRFYSAGQQITIVNTGTNYSSVTASGDPSFVSIERLSGPSVVAASETVAMGARNSSGQSIPNNSSTTITNWIEMFDTHDSFNATTGQYTVPVSGKYLVSGGVGFQIAALSAGNQCSLQIQRNGSDYQVLGGMFAQSSVSTPMAASGSVELQCVAGDILRLQSYQSMGGARLLIADVNWNYFTIVRVGN